MVVFRISMKKKIVRKNDVWSLFVHIYLLRQNSSFLFTIFILLTCIFLFDEFTSRISPFNTHTHTSNVFYRFFGGFLSFLVFFVIFHKRYSIYVNLFSCFFSQLARDLVLCVSFSFMMYCSHEWPTKYVQGKKTQDEKALTMPSWINGEEHYIV